MDCNMLQLSNQYFQVGGTVPSVRSVNRVARGTPAGPAATRRGPPDCLGQRAPPGLPAPRGHLAPRGSLAPRGLWAA